MKIRHFCRETGWTPDQVLAAPGQLLRDLSTLARLEHQLGLR